jgi:hypothetical protein
MLALPTISPTVTHTLGGGRLRPAILALADDLAAMNLFEAADLKTGAGGVNRMVEKVFERWWDAANPEPSREFPVQFFMAAPEDARGFYVDTMGHRRHAWMFLANSSRPWKWYLGDAESLLTECADEALLSHALATLYAALDDLAYCPKPPEYLAWAKNFWWDGADELPRGEAGSRGVPGRIWFDRRYPPILQAPRRSMAACRRAASTSRRGRAPLATIARACLAVDAARRTHILRPNAVDWRPHCYVSHFAIFVRSATGDNLNQLLDDYHHAAGAVHGYVSRERAFTNGFHGAWPLATAEDILLARRGLKAYARLLSTTRLLFESLGGTATSPGMGSTL